VAVELELSRGRVALDRGDLPRARACFEAGLAARRRRLRGGDAPVLAGSVCCVYTDANATHWSIVDLTLDGNKANQTVNEHRHGIFINTGSTDGLLLRTRFQNFTGDGVYHYVPLGSLWFSNHFRGRGFV